LFILNKLKEARSILKKVFVWKPSVMLLVSYPFRTFALIDMLRCGLYQIVLPLANTSYVFLCLPMLSRSLPPTSGKPVSWILALTAIVISRAKGSTFHSGPVGIRSSWVLSIWDGYMGDGKER